MVHGWIHRRETSVRQQSSCPPSFPHCVCLSTATWSLPVPKIHLIASQVYFCLVMRTLIACQVLVRFPGSKADWGTQQVHCPLQLFSKSIQFTEVCFFTAIMRRHQTVQSSAQKPATCKSTYHVPCPAFWSPFLQSVH